MSLQKVLQVFIAQIVGTLPAALVFVLKKAALYVLGNSEFRRSVCAVARALARRRAELVHCSTWTLLFQALLLALAACAAL